MSGLCPQCTAPLSHYQADYCAACGWRDLKLFPDTAPIMPDTSGPVGVGPTREWLERTIASDPNDVEPSAGSEPSWLEQRKALCDELRRLQRAATGKEGVQQAELTPEQWQDFYERVWDTDESDQVLGLSPRELQRIYRLAVEHSAQVNVEGNGR